MTRPRHPDKEVEEAVRQAEALGWTWRPQGHWGRLYCPQHDREGCQIGVNGTPRNAGNHARQILRAINRCPHGAGERGDGDV